MKKFKKVIEYKLEDHLLALGIGFYIIGFLIWYAPLLTLYFWFNKTTGYHFLFTYLFASIFYVLYFTLIYLYKRKIYYIEVKE